MCVWKNVISEYLKPANCQIMTVHAICLSQQCFHGFQFFHSSPLSGQVNNPWPFHSPNDNFPSPNEDFSIIIMCFLSLYNFASRLILFIFLASLVTWWASFVISAIVVSRFSLSFWLHQLHYQLPFFSWFLIHSLGLLTVLHTGYLFT